ncbi:MAG: hypothetical protein LC115_01075 [Bacteroidia bacterium]|nr:hypothetical protein [Bacteroidia bacterium]
MKKAKIYYYDIGDYKTRDEKLKIISEFKSFANMPLTELTPNEHGDWISVRNDAFSTFIPLEPEKKFDAKTQTFFNLNVIGISTNRDAWVYNFSKEKVAENMQRMIAFYNEQSNAFAEAKKKNSKLEVEDFVNGDSTRISWTRALRNDAKKNIQHSYNISHFRKGIYRPFINQNLYFDKNFIESPGLSSQLFPTAKSENLIINVTGIGASKEFSVVISNSLTGIDTIEKNQIFPLYYYVENNTTQKGLFDESHEKGLIRREAVSDFILERAKKIYGKNVTKEDIFHYVYGFLHSKEYRETFANDLKKMLPRLPLVEDVKDFWAFSKAGRKLAELHLNYESIEPSKEVIVLFNPLNIADTLKQANKKELEYLNYRVEKMRFSKLPSPNGEGSRVRSKDTIIYNSQITIENIPEKAYNYVVNGKSAIEWIMERYQVSTHKESGIVNNPNDWAKEQNKPKYILDLLLSIINVSVQTVDIVNALPKVKLD